MHIKCNAYLRTLLVTPRIISFFRCSFLCEHLNYAAATIRAHKSTDIIAMIPTRDAAPAASPIPIKTAIVTKDTSIVTDVPMAMVTTSKATSITKSPTVGATVSPAESTKALLERSTDPDLIVDKGFGVFPGLGAGGAVENEIDALSVERLLPHRQISHKVGGGVEQIQIRQL